MGLPQLSHLSPTSPPTSSTSPEFPPEHPQPCFLPCISPGNGSIHSCQPRPIRHRRGDKCLYGSVSPSPAWPGPPAAKPRVPPWGRRGLGAVEGGTASPDLPLTRGLLWLEKHRDGGATQSREKGKIRGDRDNLSPPRSARGRLSWAGREDAPHPYPHPHQHGYFHFNS